MNQSVSESVTIYSLFFISIGGPLVLEAEGTFTLTGILRGGGVDCSRLDDENYVANTTGVWMRVGAFSNWIRETIERETRVGRKF